MRIPRMAMALAVSAMVWGCATMGGPSGPTPVEAATAALAEYHAGVQAQDIDRIMATISDDFSNSQGGKQGMRSFMEGVAAQGLFEGMVINVEECEVVVEGDNATAKPVVYGTAMGEMSYMYKMKKEVDGVWRIINSELTY